MKIRLFTLIVLSVLPLASVAGTSFGEAAQNVLVPTAILTKLLILTCYILGAIFIFMAFAQYRVHRQSPKLVPLTTPILLFALGLICVLIPFSSKIFGQTFSAVERSDIPQTSEGESLLPLPDVPAHRSLLPIHRQEQPQPQSQSPSEAAPSPSPPPQSYDLPPSNEEGGGHWTSDPLYNQ